MRFLRSSLYEVAWILLFLIPVVTTLTTVDTWDISPWYLIAVSSWYMFLAANLLRRSLFLLITWPIIFLGLIIVGADFLLHVNILELISVFDTFSKNEVIASFVPYQHWLYLVFGLLCFIALGVWVSKAQRKPNYRHTMALLTIGVAFALYLPSSSWLRAWPATLFAVAFASEAGNQSLLLSILTSARINPRDSGLDWDARRTAQIDTNELYILVIGESVRADRLAECGGRPAMHSVNHQAIVYCDVLSGSSSTHTSVPLLISRESPGVERRISQDATFISAFNDLGFSSYWLSTQEISIAWPDATQQTNGQGTLDRDMLLPLFDQALSSANPKKLMVLHAYNAHFPYTDRYPENEAHFPVSVDLGGQKPERTTLDQWWNAYDNAVNESMKFLDMVIDRSKDAPGHVFIMYTSDHGENMLDDERDLTDHALTFPPRWDTTVPAIIWANDQWRRDNSEKYERLLQNKDRPLMHLDLIPSFLGAANITYKDDRTLPVDLGAALVGERIRIVQKRLGEIVDESEL